MLECSAFHTSFYRRIRSNTLDLAARRAFGCILAALAIICILFGAVVYQRGQAQEDFVDQEIQNGNLYANKYRPSGHIDQFMILLFSGLGLGVISGLLFAFNSPAKESATRH